MKTYRYPGVNPFTTAQRNLFFGRDKDISDLYNLILLEKLMVLFAKSGYGKSSLLSAGIIPLLQAPPQNAPRYIPLEVRLFSRNEGQISSPINSLLRFLDTSKDIGKAQPEMTFLDAITEKKSLWYHFKQRQSDTAPLRCVLIFDQFEEFFSYPVAEQSLFAKELAELLYETVPQSVREAAHHLSDEDYNRLAQAMDIKVVFAIRADRMSLLHTLKDALPAILHKRYELHSLSAAQARLAITKPAAMPDTATTQFETPPFEYSHAALTQILKGLSADNISGIEAFQLQILCQYIESLVKKGDIAQGIPVDTQHLPDFSTIYEEYYLRKIADLPEAEQHAARLIIEDALLFVDEQTGDARRISTDGDAILQRFKHEGVTQTTLKNLVNSFLIRREANSLGGYNYEISHDTLIAPINKARKKRVALEKELQTAAENARLATELQEEQAQKAALQNALTLAKQRTYIALGIAIIAALVAVFAFYSYQNAEKQTIIAEKSKRKSDSLLLQVKESKDSILAEKSKKETAFKQLQESKDSIANQQAQIQTALEGVKIEQQQPKGFDLSGTKRNSRKQAETAKNKVELKTLIEEIKNAIQADEKSIARQKYKEAIAIDSDNAELKALEKDLK